MTAINEAFRAALDRSNGVPEVSAQWACDHRDEIDFIDVREPHELEGPLGAAEGVTNVPLGQFLSTLGERRTDRPMVLICRSGRRSGSAVAQMEGLGFSCVASVAGGTIAWNYEVLGRAEIHAVEREANATNLSDAIYTYNGVPEVSPRWAHANLGRFRLIDVREDRERSGPMGKVLQSEHVPLGRLLQTALHWDKEAPYVVMCASGGRSARATAALRQSGFRRVASLEGGILGWAAAGLPRG